MRVDFQVGKGLVVAQVAIIFRQDVLDQPGFHEERVDVAFGQQVVDVADFLHQLGGTRVFGGRLQKIAAGAGTEVLGLADVNHPSGPVFHQVDARRLGKIADLLRDPAARVPRRVVLRFGGKGHFGHGTIGGAWGST